MTHVRVKKVVEPVAKITAVPLAPNSLLQTKLQTGDFVDCYSVRSDLPPRTAAQVITTFPKWVQTLMRLRGILVAPFGLSKNGPAATDKLGPFPVEQDTPHEIVAGFNDKHLNFRVAVRSFDGNVSLATWVHCHNIFGRLYLKLIMLFHIVIARNAVARVAAAQF